MAETTVTINTYTLYAHYARMLKAGQEELDVLEKYFAEGSPSNLATYIQNLESHAAFNDPNHTQYAEIRDKWAKAKTNLEDRTNPDSYISRYEKAKADVALYPGKMQELENANDVFLSPDGKRHEFLYVMDDETCAALCKQQSKEENCPQTFQGPKTITFADEQTDATRIWRNNCHIDNLQITDNRSYDIAHRDAIQLIPPPLYEEKEVTDASGKIIKEKIKLADQMAGTILENASITNCTINAPNGPLQGIFASDGMCQNIRISGNHITTKGKHAISIAGMLTGCEISNNTLRQIPPDPGKPEEPPAITLYPLRIGGNMADDGVLYASSFASGSGHDYGTVTDNNNRLIRLDGSTVSIQIHDERRIVPKHVVTMAGILKNFDYTTYFQKYTTLTVAEYKSYDPDGFSRMQAWISQRVREYSTGQRDKENGVDSPLPPPSHEQMDTKDFGVRDMLEKAQQALLEYTPEFQNTRLADLQETAIRSFTMKRIAYRNAEKAPLYDLGEVSNNKRKAYLKFLLTDAELANLTTSPYPLDTEDSASTAPTAPEPVKATGAYGTGLKDDLMATAASVAQGEEITFFFKDGSVYNSGYTFFWRVANVDSSVVAFGSAPRYTINTSTLDVKADHRVQVVLRQDGLTLSGGALFGITAKPIDAVVTSDEGAAGPTGDEGSLGSETIPTEKESLTVFLGGAGMVGAYNQDMIDALTNVGIENAHYGNYSSLPQGMDKSIFPFLDNLADANAVVFYNQAPDDPIVVEYGKLCTKTNDTTANQVVEEKEILGVNIKKYSRKIYECEAADILAFRISRDIEAIEKATFSLKDLEINAELPTHIFNLIGYSWGSIIVARSALYYAGKGVTVNNLVLIGSPINKSLLLAIKDSPLIKNIIIINLTEFGDPIYAGMTDEEIIDSASLLGEQMLDGVGHFYYSGDNPEGKQRRRKLAETLYQNGLR